MASLPFFPTMTNSSPAPALSTLEPQSPVSTQQSGKRGMDSSFEERMSRQFHRATSQNTAAAIDESELSSSTSGPLSLARTAPARDSGKADRAPTADRRPALALKEAMSSGSAEARAVAGSLGSSAPVPQESDRAPATEAEPITEKAASASSLPTESFSADPAVLSAEAIQWLLLTSSAMWLPVPSPTPVAAISDPSSAAEGSAVAGTTLSVQASDTAGDSVPILVSPATTANSTWPTGDARQIEQASVPAGSNLPSSPPELSPTSKSSAAMAALASIPRDVERVSASVASLPKAVEAANGSSPFTSPALEQAMTPQASASPLALNTLQSPFRQKESVDAAVTEQVIPATVPLSNPRGTSAAIRAAAMKTESSSASATVRPVAGADSSGESLVTRAGSAAAGVARRQQDPEGGSQQEHPSQQAFVDAQAASIEGSATDASSVSEAEAPRNSAVDSVGALRDQILSRVLEFRSQTPTSMTVILRPDSNTELSIQLRSNDGRIEVHVRMERGDSAALQDSWGTLQQSLSQHGVNLMGLETSSLPALPRAQASAEARVDLSASAGNPVLDSRLAAATAMSFASGDPQRDPSSRSGSGASGQEPPQNAGAGAGFDSRFGSANPDSGQRSPFQNRPDDVPGFGQVSASVSKHTARSNSKPSPSSVAAGAPWESWA